ncbi:multiheme c-type cytochrome [Malonomonas rubra]|uniref:multiheme c-type cytochrome n=1 Tax=Malonomonas rubra TaxID=57040 RepID=UPI0026EAAE95|nr:multiheme c-type cytochrome [Malonomonas rubra]
MMVVRGFRHLLVFMTVLLLLTSQAAAEESVCLQCHGGLEGRLGAPVAEWRTSIHAENGISCHDCHGGDPTDFAMAMSPERGFLGVPEYEAVPEFCGRCHIGVKEDYLLSAHGQAINQGGAQCVVCHDNHKVKKASPDLINHQDCSRCHEYGRADEIKAAVSDTDRMLAGLEIDLGILAKQGIAVKKMEGATFSLRNDFHRVFHTVDVDKVRSETSNFQQRGSEIQQQIDAVHDELSQRKLIGGVVAGLLFLASIIAFLIRNTYQKEEDAKR